MGVAASSGVLLDHARDKIVLVDESGRITYANDAVERILGWEPAALVGRNAFEHVHPEDVDATRAAFERTIGSDTFAETAVEYRFRAADGSWVWFESRMSNLTDGALDGYVISSHEITDLVEARRERRESATRLRELSAATSDVLWMFDADWSELLFVNPAYEEVYGQPVGRVEADPRAFLDAIHPDDIPAVEEAMACLSAGRSVDVEYRVNPEADFGVWVWVQAEPIVEDGEVVRITGFSRDITDRRRRVRQLYVMDNLLRHNLRNDLNVVLGNAERIEARAPEVADLTAVIRRTGEDLLASVEKDREILDLLQTEPERRRVDVVAAVETAVASVRDRFPGTTVGLSAPEPAFARALGEVGVAVVELLENAITHSDREHPAVSVAVEPDGDEVLVVVEDDAPPIPAAEAEVLAGHQEMNAIYHSTGLGLWLVYWTVELSGGHVSVDRDDGNRVAVALPRQRR